MSFREVLTMHSLRSISPIHGGKDFDVFPFMTISHVLDKFCDILVDFSSS